MKIRKLLLTVFGICLVLSLCLCSCGKKEKQDEPKKTTYKEKNVTGNYKDIIYLPEYFSEKDNYSNVALYDPSGEQISLRDGNLYADIMGTYKLMLHETKYIYNIEVKDMAGPFIMLNGQSTTVYWGDRVVINPHFFDNVDIDINSADLNYRVTKRSKEVEIHDNSFIATELGEYVLECDLKDAAGNPAEAITISCEMPKVIVKPVNTVIKLSDDIFTGLTDETKEYTYNLNATRVTETESSAVNGNSITIDKNSIYKIEQTAKCGDEEISLNYIYRSDGFMIWDFNDQDISMISSNTQSGLTSSKSVMESAEGDYAALIKTSGGLGWVTLTLSGLEPNMTYDRIACDVQLITAPENAVNSLRVSFYNRQGENGHTILNKNSNKTKATFSNITTNSLGDAYIYAYIHAQGVTEFMIDNLLTQKSTAVEIKEGVYIAFSGSATNVEKANRETGYSTLRLNVTKDGVQ